MVQVFELLQPIAPSKASAAIFAPPKAHSSTKVFRKGAEKIFMEVRTWKLKYYFIMQIKSSWSSFLN
jgi:hypothetical protein